MGTAVLDAPAAAPTPAFPLASAAARLLVRASVAVVVLALTALALGPRLHPFGSFYVRSGSMAPAVPVGSLVIATVARADDLKVGDVIVFERPDQPGTMVVHRIHAVEHTAAGRAFITKGDANAAPDGWRLDARGRGMRAVHVFSGVGFTVGWLDTALTRRGLLGAFAIVAALVALVWIWRSEEP
jgi:signal peptidase I